MSAQNEGAVERLSVIDGHYPAFRELDGLSFKVSVVMYATDLSFADGVKREEELQRLALCWNSHDALHARAQRLEAALRMALDDNDICGPSGNPLPLTARTVNEMRAALEGK